MAPALAQHRSDKRSLVETLTDCLRDWNLSVLAPGRGHSMSREEVDLSKALLLALAQQAVDSASEPAEQIFKQACGTYQVLQFLTPIPFDDHWGSFCSSPWINANPELQYALLDLLMFSKDHADTALQKILVLDLSKSDRYRRDFLFISLLSELHPYRISFDSRRWLAQRVLDGTYATQTKKTQAKLRGIAKTVLE